MKLRISRQTAELILADHEMQVPKWDLRKQYGVSNALISRIASGKWFEEQDAREAKEKNKRPKGTGPCPLCHRMVKLPCRECEIRVLPKRKPRRSLDKSSHVEYERTSDGSGDVVWRIVRDTPDLGFHLSPEQEAARQEVRAGVFGS